jgi:hypothetical protein
MRGEPEVHEFVETIEEYQEMLEKMSKDDFRKLLDISGQIFDQLKSNDIKAPSVAILLLEIHKQSEIRENDKPDYDYAFG